MHARAYIPKKTHLSDLDRAVRQSVLDAAIGRDAVRHVYVEAFDVLHVSNLEKVTGVAAVPSADNLSHYKSVSIYMHVLHYKSVSIYVHAQYLSQMMGFFGES